LAAQVEVAVDPSGLLNPGKVIPGRRNDLHKQRDSR
jgi:hypothetical protein